MKSRNHLPALGAILGLCVLAAASRAQTSAPPPCPPAQKQNPLAALSNSLSMLKQAVGNAGKGSAAAPAPSAASSPCTPAAGVTSGNAPAPNGAAAPATLAAADGGGAAPTSGAQPWTPPAANAPAAAARPPDLAKLPDIGGVRIGMSMTEAQAAVQKLYPSDRIAPQHAGPSASQLSVVNLRIGDGGAGSGMGVDLTMPPGPQVVYNVVRVTPQPHVARAVLLAALRQKYGKETLALGPANRVPTDDTQIYALYWVYDEQGHLVSGTKEQNGSPFGCDSYMAGISGGNGYYMNVARDINAHGPNGQMPGWCASSYVAVSVNLGPPQIFDRISIDMVDGPLLMRSARATAAWMKGQAEQARQQNLDRAQQVKPAL